MAIERYSNFTPGDEVYSTHGASFTGVPGVIHLVDNTNTGITGTLPTAPFDGCKITFENLGINNANTITAAAGGSDTIEGSASTTILPWAYVEFIYFKSVTQWRMRRFTPGLIPGSNVRRNGLGGFKVPMPSATDDVIPRGYSDTAYKPLMQANRSGWWHHPANMVGAGAAVAHTTGAGSFAPIYFNGNGTIDALGVDVTTLQVGGATTATLALYPDAGDASGPLCTGGPIRSTTANLTSTGGGAAANHIGVLGSTYAPPQGLYWTFFLYTVQTAPATTSQILHINGFMMLDIPGTSVIGTVATKGYVLTGLSAAPTTDIRSSLTTVGNVAVVAARFL